MPRYFGADIPLALEIIQVPEADDDVQPFAFIQTRLKADAVMAAIDRCDHNWW